MGAVVNWLDQYVTTVMNGLSKNSLRVSYLLF